MSDPTPRPEAPEPKPEPSPLVSSHELLQGQREIRIEHEGIIYRLRLTRRGKLILQK